MDRSRRWHLKVAADPQSAGETSTCSLIRNPLSGHDPGAGWVGGEIEAVPSDAYGEVDLERHHLVRADRQFSAPESLNAERVAERPRAPLGVTRSRRRRVVIGVMFLVMTRRCQGSPFDDAFSDPASHEPAEGIPRSPSASPTPSWATPGGDGIGEVRSRRRHDRGPSPSRREPLVGARQWVRRARSGGERRHRVMTPGGAGFARSPVCGGTRRRCGAVQRVVAGGCVQRGRSPMTVARIMRRTAGK